ncbi:hypothetical protein [Chitinophaga niabensis]|uniref:Uncharacterized protein n=1 Tax=Chitinophaga niabensis TaxID=536979 RepID=A0A1N6KC75_9BACT|nr:hypothetical protein [Chitinophaga niabensis]SIO54162.1 hypothetical protein SAMN04488055_5550 [Chitinophaga niabensis]
MRKSLRIASMVLAALLFFSYDSLKAQVKIGGNPADIDPNAILELESTKKGFLLPRVSDMSLISASTKEGYLVYFTGSGPANPAGLFVKQGAVMVRVSTETSTGMPWKLDGNTGVAGSFLGNINSHPLEFRTNNIPRITIAADGKLNFSAVDVSLPAEGINDVLVIAADGTVKKKPLVNGVTKLNSLDGELDIELTGNNAITQPTITTTPGGAGVPGIVELAYPIQEGQGASYGFMTETDYLKLKDMSDVDGFKVIAVTATAVPEGATFTKNGNKWELSLAAATATSPGIVTTGAQGFAGDKTFTNQVTTFDGSVKIAKTDPASGAPTLFVEGAATLKGTTAQTLVNANNYNILLQDPNAAGDARYEVKNVSLPAWKLSATGIGQISAPAGSATPSVGSATGNLDLEVVTTGTDFAITSAADKITFAVPNATGGATPARGLVSTGSQSFAGDKSFDGKVHVGPAFGTPQVSPSNMIVNGSVGVKFRNVPAGSTIGADDYIVLTAAATATSDLTLPNATECSGRVYVIKRIPGATPATEEDNNLIVRAAAGQNINGLATTSITVVHTSITLMSDGANWQLLSRGTGF